jgi:antitoxin (DNA-binding transcriptional repressor) of toxin-antitoxin stability system
MKLVNTHEAKTKLSELLADIEANDEVVQICRAGKPIAEMRRIVKPVRRLGEPHPVYGGIQICADLTEPLADEDLPSDLQQWAPADAT